MNEREQLGKLLSDLVSANSDMLSVADALLKTYGRISQVRQSAINEVADEYHGELSRFYTQQADSEKVFAGIAEKHANIARTHRVYADEIRKQVWTTDKAKNDKSWLRSQKLERIRSRKIAS